MLFSNATVLKIRGHAPDAAELEAMAIMWPFQECEPTQEFTMGLVPPRGEEGGALVESVAGHRVLRVMTESKSVPADVVKRRANARAKAIEAETGRKPGKKEMRELREEAKLALLPHAFPKRAAVGIWIDPERGRLVIDSTSQGVIDDILTILVRGIEGLVLQEMHTATSCTAMMSRALLEGEAPAGFDVGRECSLKASDASKAAVQHKNRSLDNEDVREHVQGGLLPVHLALTWDGRVDFVLTESMQLRRIDFLDGVFDGMANDQKADAFDADAAIVTGELRRLLDGLVAALGGELEPQQEGGAA